MDGTSVFKVSPQERRWCLRLLGFENDDSLKNEMLGIIGTLIVAAVLYGLVALVNGALR